MNYWLSRLIDKLILGIRSQNKQLTMKQQALDGGQQWREMAGNRSTIWVSRVG